MAHVARPSSISKESLENCGIGVRMGAGQHCHYMRLGDAVLGKGFILHLRDAFRRLGELCKEYRTACFSRYSGYDLWGRCYACTVSCFVTAKRVAIKGFQFLPHQSETKARSGAQRY